jgi:hypothetical protein
VIQFLGLLHEPIQIATVDGNGNRLIIDFRKSRLFDPHTDFWHDLHSLPQGSPLDVARNQLINGWSELKQTPLPIAATAPPF